MLTSAEVASRRMYDAEVQVSEIAEHFEETIFWNWVESISVALNDRDRLNGEIPLIVGEGPVNYPIQFEYGETLFTVATVHVTDRDDSAHETDAHFVACLPVYIPTLFRRIQQLEQELERLNGYMAGR